MINSERPQTGIEVARRQDILSPELGAIALASINYQEARTIHVVVPTPEIWEHLPLYSDRPPTGQIAIDTLESDSHTRPFVIPPKSD